MMKEDFIISQEEESEQRAVEELTREAFWNLYVPGADEHYLLNTLRKSPDFVKELCLVVKEGDQIIGNIAYSRSVIERDNGDSLPVITFGPVSVLPTKQSKGVGSLLIRKSIEVAKSLGFKAIVIQGYPSYYKRFGFQNAKLFGISAADGSYPKSLQILELEKDALKGVSGKFHESSVFNVDGEKAKEFDKSFPEKEKFATRSQKAFEIFLQLTHDDPEPEGIERIASCRDRIKADETTK